MVKQPSNFNAYLSASPYLTNPKDALFDQVNPWRSQGNRLTFSYTTLGDEQRLQPGFNALKQILEVTNPVKLKWQITFFQGESQMSTPSLTVHKGLRALYADMRMTPDSPLFTGGAPAIKTHFQKLAKEKYDYTLSWEKAVRDYAMSLLRRRDMSGAIEVLQGNAEDYPKSWPIPFRLSRIY